MGKPKIDLSDAALLRQADALDTGAFAIDEIKEAAATLRAIVAARQAPEDVVEALAAWLFDRDEGCGPQALYHPNQPQHWRVEYEAAARAFLAAHWPLSATPVDGRMQADPVVKPLVWEHYEANLENDEHYGVDCDFGSYYIEPYGKEVFFASVQIGDVITRVGGKFTNPEAAKAAAQADYETRIRAALVQPAKEGE